MRPRVSTWKRSGASGRPPDRRRYSGPMRRGRAPLLLLFALGAAVAGGALALAIGAGAGWIGRESKTVVVKAQSGPQADLPAAVRSRAAPIPGNGFDPARIFASRSPGVVTIFAFFGDPTSNAVEGAQGSGFVISSKGYILTNSHVITNAGEVGAGAVKPASHLFVEFSDRDRVPATVVGWDVYDDVGLIKIDPRGHRLAPVPLGDSSAVVVGEPVAAIGSPLGNEDSLSVGVVSAVHRAIKALTVARSSARLLGQGGCAGRDGLTAGAGRRRRPARERQGGRRARLRGSEDRRRRHRCNRRQAGTERRRRRPHRLVRPAAGGSCDVHRRARNDAENGRRHTRRPRPRVCGGLAPGSRGHKRRERPAGIV